MLILGVDPGSIATGYGVIRKERSRSIHIDSGVIKNSASKSQSKRLLEVHVKLSNVIKEYQPDVLAVETLFHGHNAQTLIKLSQIRGVILLLGEINGMKVVEYAPVEIKNGLTGFGRADKAQMIFMVGKLLNMPELKSPDQADALAVALYHSHVSLYNGIKI